MEKIYTEQERRFFEIAATQAERKRLGIDPVSGEFVQKIPLTGNVLAGHDGSKWEVIGHGGSHSHLSVSLRKLMESETP